MSGGPAAVPDKPVDARAVMDAMEAHRVAHALGGRATVRLQGPHGNQSAEVAFVADPAGRMRADITALFGFPLATLVVADEDFAFFEYGSNRYVMGRLDGEGLGEFSALPLHPAELFSLVTGVLPLDGYALEEGSFARRG
jgi:hypothetical protein